MRGPFWSCSAFSSDRSSALFSSGPNSLSWIKSEAKKSGLTSRTAIRVLVSAALIAASHSDPGRICWSDHVVTDPARTYGVRWVSRSMRQVSSSWL
jgi:hypothetical protein